MGLRTASTRRAKKGWRYGSHTRKVFPGGRRDPLVSNAVTGQERTVGTGSGHRT
jgi:hypothetical protein